MYFVDERNIRTIFSDLGVQVVHIKVRQISKMLKW